MKKWIFIFLLMPSLLSAQTWQKAWQGAQRALAKPATSLPATQQALKQSRRSLKAPNQSIDLWLNGRHSAVTPVLTERLDAWAALSNRLMRKDFSLRQKQLQFFARHPFEAGLLSTLSQGELPARIGADVHYVLVGGKEHDFQSFSAFKKIIMEYREAFPDRKIIVLSETLPDKGVRFASGFTAAESDKNFILSFAHEGLSIGGLKDASIQKEGYVTQENTNLLLPADKTAAGEAVRAWHMRGSLAQWREEFPRAIFFVYVSPLSAAYDWKYALANMLNEKEVFSINITSVRGSRDFLFHRWRNFKDARPGTLAWNNKEWARMSGFDAQVILP